MSVTKNLRELLRDAISRRDEAQRDIDYLEKMLTRAVRPESSQKGTSNYSDRVAEISYQDEAEAWVKEQKEKFTINDFHNYLIGKYGEHSINYQSVRNPFRRLKDSGWIKIVTESSGKKPTLYITSLSESSLIDKNFFKRRKPSQ